MTNANNRRMQALADELDGLQLGGTASRSQQRARKAAAQKRLAAAADRDERAVAQERARQTFNEQCYWTDLYGSQTAERLEREKRMLGVIEERAADADTDKAAGSMTRKERVAAGEDLSRKRHGACAMDLAGLASGEWREVTVGALRCEYMVVDAPSPSTGEPGRVRLYLYEDDEETVELDVHLSSWALPPGKTSTPQLPVSAKALRALRTDGGYESWHRASTECHALTGGDFTRTGERAVPEKDWRRYLLLLVAVASAADVMRVSRAYALVDRLRFHWQVAELAARQEAGGGEHKGGKDRAGTVGGGNGHK